MTRAALASRMVRGMPPWEPGGVDSEQIPVPPRASLGQKPDPLAAATGRPTISTVGDAIDGMLDLGLILLEVRHGDQLLVPNPSPELAWERLGLTGYDLLMARSQALEEDHRATSGQIENAIRWSGGRGLSSTPRAMALRWSTTVEDVLGALRLLGGSGRTVAGRELTFDSQIDADEHLVLRQSAPHWLSYVGLV